MANDPNRYAALDKAWNMGPFYALVHADTGAVVGDGDVSLYRRVGPHFFENAKANKLVVRVATIQLVGPPVETGEKP